MNVALAMAEEAVKGGVTVAAATPHFFQLPDWEKIQSLTAVLQHELDRAGIPLRVVAGGELFMDIEILDMAPSQIPAYGANGRYCLLEFPMQQVPLYAEQVLFSLQTKGVTPIIAHPERYVAVMNDPNLVLHWIELGCAIQMNTGSILGRFGPKVHETAKILLEHDMVHVLATDGHGVRRRGMNLPQAYGAVEELVGKDSALALVQGNPELIIQGEPISLEGARRYKKRKRFWFF